MKRWSSRWIDTSQYKTKEILLKIVGDRIKDLKLVNKTRTEYVSLCPFHKERTASFKLHNNGGKTCWMYKCFGCGRSGDVFRFLMVYERWEFWEALAYIRKYSFNLKTFFPCTADLSQLKISFPTGEHGGFVWVSQDMRQIGYK